MALEEPKEDDLILRDGGARLYVEQRVSKWYDGAELDWEGDGWNPGFRIRHPNYGTCG